MNLIHGIETVIDMIASDAIIKEYANNFRIWPETICQALNLFGCAFMIGWFFDEDPTSTKLLKY